MAPLIVSKASARSCTSSLVLIMGMSVSTSPSPMLFAARVSLRKGVAIKLASPNANASPITSAAQFRPMISHTARLAFCVVS